MNSEKDTLPNNEQLLQAILEMRQEMNARFEQFDGRLEEMRLQMMSFDVRIDRIEALTHEVLNVAYNARADVKVLREEVHGWSKEVRNLQLKVA